MYSVIIIDDEKMTRDTVSRYINDKMPDFEVVGCFSGGKQAFSYISENKVDVVITDIKMPKMSGIELIEKINDIDLDCHIIIISGFGEFEYAKKAVEYHVENYILKPIDIDELLNTLNNIKKKLDLKKSSNSVSTEEFFVDLLKGGMTDKNSIIEKYNKMDFPVTFENSFGCVFVVEITNFNEYIIENWKHGKNGIYIAFLNIFKIKFKIENVYVIENSNSGFFFVCLCEKSLLNFSTEEFVKTFKDILNIDISVQKKEYFSNIIELPPIVSSFIGIKEIISLLFMHFVNGEKAEAVSILNKYCNNNNEYYNSIIEHLYFYLEKLGINFTKVEKFADYEKCVDYFIYNIRAHNPEDAFIVERAKKFIEMNYYRDISRDDVANAVFLNSAYFSRYFKKKTGETFYNYLLKIRMNKAKELFAEGKSITEVSNLVGYANIRYFNQKFKQIVGCSPSEYKKNANNTENL